MRFQLFASRTAFAALLLAVLAGAGAVTCVRLGLLTDKGGSTLMIPATGLGLAALAMAFLWLRSALARKESRGLHFSSDWPDPLPEAKDTVLDPRTVSL